MKRNIVETLVGGLVLAVAIGFLVQLLGAADVGATQNGYQLEARFWRAGGLQSGADVRVNGIKVGTVVEHRLDHEKFEAVMTFVVERQIRLPDDTEALIASEGLLGGKYLRLDPGSSDVFLADGGRIKKSHDFKSIEDTVAEIIFLATN